MIAPWLQPPNVLGAMQAGAQVGLAQRAQRVNEVEAAQRLRLAYDQMAALQQREQMDMAFRSQIEGARLAQQLREMNAMEQWRKSQQANWTADNTEQNRHNLAMEGTAAARLAQEQNASAFDYKPEVIELEGSKFAYNPKTGSFKPLASEKDISATDALRLAERLQATAKEYGESDPERKRILDRANALYEYARRAAPNIGLPGGVVNPAEGTAETDATQPQQGGNFWDNARQIAGLSPAAYVMPNLLPMGITLPGKKSSSPRIRRWNPETGEFE